MLEHSRRFHKQIIDLFGVIFVFVLLSLSPHLRASSFGPVITLVGTSVTINVDGTYVEPGFSAVDGFGSSITVDSTNDINTSLAGTYTVTYTATDQYGATDTKFRTVTVVAPNTAPTITLIGSATVTIIQGGTFTDPGTTVTDSQDSGLTATPSGTVDTLFLGTYTLTYNATDSGGLSATAVTRTVTVVANTAPTITLVGSATISVVQGGTFSDEGATVTDDQGSLSATVVGSVDTTTVGTYTLTYSATDAGGLSATATRTVTVTAPNTAPTITLVGASTITVVQGGTFADPGATATDTQNGTLTEYIAVTGTVNTAVVGTYTLTYNVSDFDGLSTTATRAVTVTAPNTAPVITLVGSAVISIVQGDSFSDPGATVTDGQDSSLTATVTGTVDTAIVGVYPLTYSAIDTGGLAAVPVTRTVTVFADNVDADVDGVNDAIDNCPAVPNLDQLNSDSDTQGDACDSDDDNDTIVDELDNCPVNPNLNQANLDGDNLGDVCDPDDDGDVIIDALDNCPTIPNGSQADLDGDGLGNICDPDDDGDSVADNVDNCPVNSNADQSDLDNDLAGDVCDLDDDNDSVPDAIDNCPVIANQSQSNLDGDAAGDACDLDADGDGAADLVDNCPVIPNANQLDSDGDGVGDACQGDLDGDGLNDPVDNCPLIANADQLDTDGDALGNVCDPDDDNDGILDVTDAFPLDATEVGDNDADGIGDIADTDDDNDGVSDVDEISAGQDPLNSDRVAPTTFVGGRTTNINDFSVQLTCDDDTFGGNCQIFASTDPTALASAFSLLNSDTVTFNLNEVVRYFARDPAGNVSSVFKVPGNILTKMSMEPGVRSIDIVNLSVLHLDLPGAIESGLSGRNMSNLLVELDLQLPAGKSQRAIRSGKTENVDNAAGETVGNFTFDDLQEDISQNGAILPGVYGFTGRFDGSSVLRASDSGRQQVLIGRPAGYAVVVQGRIASKEGEASHQKTTNRVYQALLDRGLLPANIRYLSHRDGFNQAAGLVPTKANLELALNQLGEKMATAPAPFFLVMVDHGTGGNFYISESETITPPELDVLLDGFEARANLAERADEKPRVVVLGYCYSGEFLEPLVIDAPAGRVVIASAAPDEESYKGVLEEDNIRVGEFFLEALFNSLSEDQDLNSAFVEATRKTEIYTRSGSEEAPKPPFFDSARQHPLLEDTPDDGTLGNNELTRGFGDGVLSSNIYLGFAKGTNAVPLSITDVTPTQYLAAGASTAKLFANLSDNTLVNAVFVEVRDLIEPLPQPNEQRNFTLQRELKTSSPIRTGLVPDPRDNGGKRWEVKQGREFDFADAGQYEVYYNASDRETKRAAPSQRSVVYVNAAGNLAPEAFDLLSPADKEHVRTSSLFTWSETVDSDDANSIYAVSYNLVISRESCQVGLVDADHCDFANDPRFDPTVEAVFGEYFIAEEIPVSNYAVDTTAGLTDGATYYWKVEAIDRYGARRDSAQRLFVADNTNEFAGPDLFVRQISADQQTAAGYDVLVEVEVSNLGGQVDDEAANVRLETKIPAQMVLKNNQPPAGCTLIAATSTVRCELGNLSKSDAAVSRFLELEVLKTGRATLTSVVGGFKDAAQTVRQPDEVFSNNVSSLRFLLGSSADTDGDGIPDADERKYSLNPNDASDAGVDADGDGTTNLEEYLARTDPNFSDRVGIPGDLDDDGVVDSEEVPERIDSTKGIESPIVAKILKSPSGTPISVPANATAVVLNITAVNPSVAGYITVWPCGVERPLASNVNYVAGDVKPNGVIAPLGGNGAVCFYSQSDTDLVVDIAGWFAGDTFAGATPQRLVDTREGRGVVTPDVPLSIDMTALQATTSEGVATTVPSISAASLNVTVVNPQGAGYVTVYPCDVPKPTASNVNFAAGDVVANGVIAPVSASGEICVFASVPTDIVVDLAGWFPGSGFTAAAPARLIDTRDETGGPAGMLMPASPLNVAVHNAALTISGSSQLVPFAATAAALNVTVVNPQAAGFVTVWPCSATQPVASNLNFKAGQIVANNVIAPIGTSGSVCFYSNVPTDIVVDIAGYFSGDAGNAFVGSTPTRVIDTREALGPAPK